MVWALLLLIAVVLGIHWWEYSQSTQEYTFAQPPPLAGAGGTNPPGTAGELRAVLSEKTPVVLEIGPLPWRPTVTEKAAWSVETGAAGGAGVSISVGAWVAQGAGRPALLNSESVAEQMDLPTGLAELDSARAWWWLPGFQDCAVDILPAAGWTGLTWVTAERQWIGCSHGAPLKIWLAHSRYQPFLPASVRGGADSVNPWTVTVAEAPWLGRVQYIEVIVRPGWCLGVPAHWGWAATPVAEGEPESWWWTASQHSPLSMALTAC